MAGQRKAAEGQGKAVAGQGKAMAGHIQAVAGKGKAVAGHRQAVAGQEKAAEGHIQAVAGQEKAAEGHIQAVAGQPVSARCCRLFRPGPPPRSAATPQGCDTTRGKKGTVSSEERRPNTRKGSALGEDESPVPFPCGHLQRLAHGGHQPGRERNLTRPPIHPPPCCWCCRFHCTALSLPPAGSSRGAERRRQHKLAVPGTVRPAAPRRRRSRTARSQGWCLRSGCRSTRGQPRLERESNSAPSKIHEEPGSGSPPPTSFRPALVWRKRGWGHRLWWAAHV